MRDRSGRVAVSAVRAGLGLLIVATTVLSTGGAAYATTTATLTPGQPTPGNTRALSWTVVDPAAPANLLECQVSDPTGTLLWPAAPCVAGDVLSVTLGTGAVEGAYTARVTDLGTLSSVDDVYTFDITAADPIFTATPPSPTNSGSLVWSWTSSEPSDECMLAAPGTDGFTWTACAGGTITVTPTAPAGGSYTLSVRGVDALGNTSPGISDSVVRDVTAANPSFVSTPLSPTRATSLTWTWTSTEPTDECRVVSSILADSFGWTACAGGTYTLTTAATVSGSYVFSVRGVDALGNVSSGISSTVQRDLDGPVISGLAVTPSTVNHTSNPAATWSGTTGSDVVTCRVDDGTGTVVPATTCTSPWSVPVGSLPSGSYTVVVSAVDNLGNAGPQSSAGFTVDLVGPLTGPQLLSTPGVTGNDDTPTWTFTVGSGESAECQFESSQDGVLTVWTSCGTGTGTNTVTVQSVLTTANPQSTYTLRIRALDAIGNVGAETDSSYLFDSIAPPAPSLTLVAAAGQSPSITASWVGTETARCTVTSSAAVVVVGPAASCASGGTLALPLTEDVYTLTVTLTDAAGNTSSPGTATYRYDITAPGAPGVSGPTQGNTTTPSFALTPTEAGEVLSCTWRLPPMSPAGSPTVLGPSTCSGSAYRPSPALSGDGPWTLSVVGRDAAGNTSTPTVRTYNLDTGPPPAPTVSLATGTTTPGNDLTPTWAFMSEAGSTTECELRTGSTVLSAWGPCAGGTVTYNLTPVDPTVVPDGVYTVFVRATDAFGNTGTAGSAPYTLDTLPPAAPSWISQPVGPSSAPASWQFSTGGNQAECELSYAGVVLGTWTACSSPWIPGLGADGDYTLTVRAVDAAGNPGDAVTSVAFLFDTTGPGVPLLTQSPATPAPEQLPVVGFSVDASATAADCRITSGGAAVMDWAPCGSPWVADLTAQADGVYGLEVRAVDAAGNASRTLAVAYTLDSSAPVAVGFIAGPTGPARGRMPVFSFPVAPGSSAQCQVRSASATLVTWTACAPPCPAASVSDCSASYTLDLTGLVDGTYRLFVRLVDSAGNQSADKFASYLLDTTPPAAAVFGLLPASPTADPVTDWRWTGEAGAAPQCKLTSGTRTVLGWRPCVSPYRVNLSGQPDGTYTFWVRLTDRAGNTSAARTASVVRDTTAPTVVFITTPPAVTAIRKLRWTWSNDPGVSTTCLFTRGAVVVLDWKPCADLFAVNLAGQPDGTYRLSVRPVDSAGNMGRVTSGAVTLTTQLPPPPGGGSPGGSIPPPSVKPPVTIPPVPTVDKPPVITPPVAHPPVPAPPPTQRPTRHHPVPTGGSLVPPAPVSRVPDLLGRAAVRSLDKPQIPLIIVVLIIAFLLIQNRIDRRDPKLAEAPLGAEPTLGFGSIRGAT